MRTVPSPLAPRVRVRVRGKTAPECASRLVCPEPWAKFKLAVSTSHSTLNIRRKAKSSPKRAFLMWLGYEDSNLGMPESESGALPLGDTPTGCTYKVSVLNKLAGVRGFEPRNAGIRIRCLTAWRYPNKLVLNLPNIFDTFRIWWLRRDSNL